MPDLPFARARLPIFNVTDSIREIDEYIEQRHFDEARPSPSRRGYNTGELSSWGRNRRCVTSLFRTDSFERLNALRVFPLCVVRQFTIRMVDFALSDFTAIISVVDT